MADKIKVLYVDDEPDNLVGFKATLRFKYTVFTASDVPHAIKYLNAHRDIRVIFCDQRMPGKTGVDFFEEIRISHPLPVRILLTAYTDVEAIINAINKGQVFRYVKKPWSEADIISAIEEANKFYLANSMLFIKNTELERAYDELNKFAYSISHDIRGPLTGILGAINIIREIDNVTEMQDMLQLMEKSLKKLDSYVISMHEYYSLQRGELTISEINFNKIVDELKPGYVMLSKVSKVAFNISIKQQEVFRSNEAILKLILNNLLSNAFKYQDEKHKNKLVDLIIEVHNSLATIYIRDTGVGILGTHVNEIFDLFYKANSQEGSGLGLYNVKSALAKLNGQIEVSSVMNQGTTFRVTIPSI